MAGDVSGIRRSQEGDGVCDLLIGAGAAQRDHFGHALAQLRTEHLSHCRLNPPRSNCIHGNVARGYFACHCHCETDQSSLGSSIIGLPGLPHLPKDAGDVDDSSPALFQHGADCRLDAEIWRSEIGVEHRVPVCTFHAHDQLIASDTRIVYQDVNLPEAIECRLESSFDLLFLSNIHAETGRLSAGAGYLRFNLTQLFDIACRQSDAGALWGKPQRASTPYSLRCSGNKSDSAFEWFHGKLIRAEL